MLSKIFLISVCLAALISGFHAKNYGPQTFNNDNNDGGGYQDYNSDGYRAPPPAILTHKQAVTNDGVFNYVFAADNGLKQGESISPDGTRTGAYQYIDTNGKTVSVKYTAGKDGFKIIEGDHVPRQPEPYKTQSEYQSPEYQDNYQNEQKPYQGNGKKYPVESQQYRLPQEQEDDGQYHRETTPKQNKQYQKSQKYTAPPQQNAKPKPKFFELPELTEVRPHRYQGGNRAPAEPTRTMLYNVEQRHVVNYRKYQDNGKPVDGGENYGESAAGAQDPTIPRGYNFEFKG